MALVHWDAPAGTEPEPQKDQLVDVQFGPEDSTVVEVGRIVRVQPGPYGATTCSIFVAVGRAEEDLLERYGEFGVRLREDFVEHVIESAGPVPYNVELS